MDPPLPPKFNDRHWRYKCAQCGAERIAGTAEVMRHFETVQSPRCCGEIMRLSAIEEPGEDGPR